MASQDFVTVIQSRILWTVRVVENRVMMERAFSLESHAIAWASGQRIRLDLPPHDRFVLQVFP